jgi:hypothetical protein
VKPEVQQAVDEIKAQVTESSVSVREDGQGGAYLLVEPVDLGPTYTQETRRTWMGFHLPFQYPFADVYPHHVRRDLTRADARPLGEGMGHSRYEGFERDSVQLSRRSNHREAALEKAVHKMLKVIEWARSRP